MAVFCDIAQRSSVDISRRFREACCLRYEDYERTILKMETVKFSETSVGIYQTALSCIPADTVCAGVRPNVAVSPKETLIRAARQSLLNSAEF
jgi:hypothetical protein